MIDDELGHDPQDQTLRLWAELASKWVEERIAQLPAKDPQLAAAKQALQMATTKELAEAYRQSVAIYEELLIPSLSPGHRETLTGYARQYCVDLLVHSAPAQRR